MKEDDNESDAAEVHDRLLKIISNLSDLQKEKLLYALRKWEQPKPTVKQKPKFAEKREHFRKDSPVYGIFETKNRQFREFTKNVSVGGLLIDPEIRPSYHENIFITLFHNNFNLPVRTNGKVVRVDPDGVGLQFDQVIPRMSSV